MTKERGLALFGAIALLTTGVWLSQESNSESPKKEAHREKKNIAFPRSEKAKAKIRQKRAMSINPLNQKQVYGMQKGARALMQALDVSGKSNIFVDVQALAQSPLLQKILDCRAAETNAPLKEIEQSFGIHLLEDVSRFGAALGVTAVTGAFRDLKVPTELGDGKPYGNTAYVFSAPKDEQMLAKVGENLVLLAENEAQLQAAIDRVEGESPLTNSLSQAALNEADVVANLDSDLLEKLLSGISPEFSTQTKALLEDGVMRLNVEADVTASFDFKATSEKNGSDLSTALRGALAGLRTKAATNSDSRLVELLSQSHIEDFEDGTFALDLAVPGSFLLNLLECNTENLKKESAPAQNSEQ